MCMYKMKRNKTKIEKKGHRDRERERRKIYSEYSIKYG